MSAELPPPAPPSCLTRPYSSKPEQKGGTLIADDVHDRDAHERRLLDPDGYRPEKCPHCGHGVLHAHDYRLRTPRDLPRGTSILVRRYICTSETCSAGWQVLPGFLARHLQRAWSTIEKVVEPSVEDAGLAPKPVASPEAVPLSTLKRYVLRFSSCASSIRATFATLVASLDDRVKAVLSSLAPSVTRAAFCGALTSAGLLDSTRRLASLAAWIHRLAPGLRLM